MAISKAAIEEIISAVMATDVMQFCKGLMDKPRGIAQEEKANAQRRAGNLVPGIAPAAAAYSRQSELTPLQRQLADERRAKDDLINRAAWARRFADETTEMVRYSRAAGEPIDYDVARQHVYDFHYKRSKRPHKFHQLVSIERYRREAEIEMLERDVRALEDDSSSQTALDRKNRIVAHAAAHGTDYATSRAALGF